MIILTLFLAHFGLLNAQPRLSWSLGNPERLNINMPHGDVWPDGHLSVIKSKDNSKYLAFWSEFQNYRTVASTSNLKDHINKRDPSGKVFGGRDEDYPPFETQWSNGGAWFTGIHRLDDGRLAGFFHAEDHWSPRRNNYTAYKTMGVTYSSNDGVSWGASTQILRPPYGKPTERRWSGLGDAAVIWNPFSSRYMAYYSAVRFRNNDANSGIEINNAQICLAASNDKNGFSSWFKHDGVGFNQPGLGGYDTPIKNIEYKPGANPSVHYNTCVKGFIMVWHGWDPKFVYISSSSDGINWGVPQVLVNDGNAVYPNIIGETHDIGGQTVRLYYGQEYDGGDRYFMTRTISFACN